MNGRTTASWKWGHREALLLLHEESQAEHGGASGLRDAGLLDSALARPLHLALHGQPDLAALAASYGIGMAANHPFVDGNKRAALLAVGLFLYVNGQRLHATQVQTTLTMLAVASGELDEAGFAAWLRAHIRPR